MKRRATKCNLISHESRCRYQRICQRRLKRKNSACSCRLSAERRCTLIKSIATEQELLQVMARPQLARLIAPPFLKALSRMLLAAKLVTITEQVTECRDPKDDKFLELAINGKADMIISGDHDLLILNPFREIPIINPAAFIQIITG